MRIHYLQHVPFENLANIEVWVKEKGHSLSVTHLYREQSLPAIDQFDWLIIMGGPMNIYEEKIYPWLVAEKRFILRAIQAEKIVLGICLGAQLIADVLGGKVSRNSQTEIGWFPINKTEESKESILFNSLPDQFVAFHWHGDAFSVPPGALGIAESEGCKNQAFEYNGKVLGLQFHLETSKQSLKMLIENCGDEIIVGNYIQSKEEMLSPTTYFNEAQKYLNILLDELEMKGN